MGGEHLRRRASGRRPRHLLHHPDPLVDAIDVTDALAPAQHRAEALARDVEVVHLAGGDRGHGAVEAIEALAHSTLRDEGQAAICQCSHLEVVVVELDRDGEGPIGAGLELVDIRTVARHVRELVVPPFHARTDLFERAPSPIEPAPAGCRVAERVVVELGERDGDPARGAHVAPVSVATERGLGVATALDELVGLERGARGPMVLLGRHPLIVGLAMLVA